MRIEDVVYWLVVAAIYAAIYLVYKKVLYPKYVQKWLGGSRFFELLGKDLFVFLVGLLLLAVLYFLIQS